MDLISLLSIIFLPIEPYYRPATFLFFLLHLHILLLRRLANSTLRQARARRNPTSFDMDPIKIDRLENAKIYWNDQKCKN